MAQGRDLSVLPYRAGLFPFDPVFAFILCLIITLGQNYAAFLKGTIDWGGATATYIGLPVFLAVWGCYRLWRGGGIVRYADMRFPAPRF